MDEQASYEAARLRFVELKQEYREQRRLVRKLTPWRRRWRRRALWILLLFLPLQYVASIGPVNGLYARGFMSESFVDAWIRPIYAPLNALGQHVPAFESVVEWYMEFWEPRVWTPAPK